MAETPPDEPHWERRVLERIALEGLAEQRRRRRWGIFFKLVVLFYIGLFFLLFVDWESSTEKISEGARHTAVVQLNGVIQPKGDASAERVIAALQSAFEDKGTAGVILRINSPGGSPVQSGMINDEMRRLRAKYPHTPLYARGGEEGGLHAPPPTARRT